LPHNRYYGGSIFGSADTLLGPFFLGIGYGNGGNLVGYFYLGTNF
jgi:NTE family protein